MFDKLPLGVIYLHIRAVGQWTNRLYEYFEEEQSKLLAGNGEEICLRPAMPKLSNAVGRMETQMCVSG